MEEYKPIEGFENYSVSNYGNVRNNKTGRILKPGLSSGYPSVRLCINRMIYNKTIHRLVAKAFCENENNYECVDHIDGNKCNNHHLNLRWITYSQNSRNSKKREGGSSRYLGVCFDNQKQKWKAHIKLNKKYKHLGYYDTENEAHATFCKAVYDNNLAEFYPTNELHFTN